MKKIRVGLNVLRLFSLLFFAANSFGANGVEKIPWAQLPQVVQKMAHRHIVRHGDVHKSTEDGEVFYNVRGKKDGKQVELSASNDGKLLRLEQQMDLGKIPDVVQKSLKEKVGESKVEQVTKKTEDGEVSYQADVTKGNRNFSLDFNSEGKFLRISEDMELAEIPAAVQKRIKGELGAAKIESIGKVVEDGETSFEVEIFHDGKTSELSIAPDGELLWKEISLAESPIAVQKTIRERVGGGKLGDISKTTDKGDVFYDVNFSRDGKSRSLTIDEKGVSESEEEEVSLAQTPAAVQKTIRGKLGEGKVESISKGSDEGEIYYDVAISEKEKREEFSVGKNGELLEDQ